MDKEEEQAIREMYRQLFPELEEAMIDRLIEHERRIREASTDEASV